jgi:hypothetical protein
MFGIPKFDLDHKSEKQAEIEKPLETEVKLEIFRHSKKENAPEKPNMEVRLTPEGRELAREKGKTFNPNINVSVAGASPFDRTAETAMLIMGANEEKIKVDDSLAEMDKKIAEEIKFGKKIFRDERLGLDLVNNKEEGMAAIKAGNYMDWLANRSDEKAILMGDVESTTYLRQAGNVAYFVDRYSKIGNNFNKLAAEKNKEGEEFPNHLERYIGTHQNVAEAFVAEVIKFQDSPEAQQKFVKDIKNCWPETEGISLRIINKGPEQSILLSYKDQGEPKEIDLKSETVQKIISRRETFEEGVKRAKHLGQHLEESAKI